jgi:hypothetical protein
VPKLASGEIRRIIELNLLRTVETSEENYLLYQRKREEAAMTDALDCTRILNVAVAEQPTVPCAAVQFSLAVSARGRSPCNHGQSRDGVHFGVSGPLFPDTNASNCGIEHSSLGSSSADSARDSGMAMAAGITRPQMLLHRLRHAGLGRQGEEF